MSVDRQGHWESAYSSKRPDETSWFQVRPQVSLDLIERTGVSKGAPIIDVGGGASTLVDHLLDAGYSSISVLDVAEASLAHSRARLGERAASVKWIVADITRYQPRVGHQVWHDRAVLHFLTSPIDQRAYGDALRAAVEKNGWVIIGGFAKGGPVRCSGLEIVQHDAASLAGLLGGEFSLVGERSETHRTPWAAEQLFAYHLFRRRS